MLFYFKNYIIEKSANLTAFFPLCYNHFKRKKRGNKLHLKELSLKGFKSFADKTSFLFDPPPSVAAVVGPNGCGKSNIIDAMRFVLGEQSIKDLRGTSLEEVIFAGSSTRKSVSMAEVSLLLDNSDGYLKTEYSEVLVKRRVFRSGESEFFINKNLCRLKDIKELFMDTGIGNGAYSIVNQGQVDLILSSKPEDRRSIFEEAAGINKYKFRKKAAERRLIGTEQNLLRVNDLRGEIKENLSSLEEQAKKAKRYKEAKDGLRSVEVGLAKKQVRSLSERMGQLKAKIEELKTKTRGAEDGAAKEEEERTRAKALIRNIESTVESLRLEMASGKSAVEEALTKISVGKERIFQLEERLAEIHKEIERLGALRASKEEKTGEKHKNLTEFEDRFGHAKQYLEEAQTSLEEINRKTEESIRGWNSLKNPIFEREMEISSQKHRISELELSIKYAKESLAKESSFLDNLIGLKEDISFLESEVLGLQGVSQELKERLSSRKIEIFGKIDIEIEVIQKNIKAQEESLGLLESEKEKESSCLKNTEQRAGEMTSQFSSLENKLKELNAEKETAIAHLAETRANFANNDSLLKQKKEEDASAREQVSEVDRQIKDKKEEESTLSLRISQTKESISGAEGSIPGLREKEQIASQKLQKAAIEKQAEQARLEELEERIRGLSGEDRAARDDLSKEEISFAKLEGEFGAIEALMQQEYGLSAAQVLESPEEEVQNQTKAKEEIERLRMEIREIGPVNLLAVEEFEATKERLSFIDAQCTDLISARDNLNGLISQLDNEARQKFVVTIEEVNKNFCQVFSSLFEGGEAKISLSDGDPLEAGIEIFARPSGKKWLSLALMSGGEKSLTAISILFALIRTKPSPFCFMDEVDAALDEINTIRFSKLVKEFSKESQMIVVTHSKRTMSAAGAMYGVTMEDPGVSKLVSMKLVKVAD